jgi:hypothetical protein
MTSARSSNVNSPPWPTHDRCRRRRRHVAVDDTIWQTLVSLQTACSSMAQGGRIVQLVPTIGLARAAARSAEQHTPADLSVSRPRRLP